MEEPRKSLKVYYTPPYVGHMDSKAFTNFKLLKVVLSQ
jgi:hypothetical protein